MKNWILKGMFLALLGCTLPAMAEQPATAKTTSEAELVFWNTIKDSKDPAEFRAYLDQYPHGVFANLATIKMNKLGRTADPVPVNTTANPSAPAGKTFNYTVNFNRKLNDQPLTNSGTLWYTNNTDAERRYHCLLGAIGEQGTLGAALFDLKRLLNDADSGREQKVHIAAYNGKEGVSYYKIAKNGENSGQSLYHISGFSIVPGFASNDRVNFTIDLQIDLAKMQLTTAAGLFTNAANGRSKCTLTYQP